MIGGIVVRGLAAGLAVAIASVSPAAADYIWVNTITPSNYYGPLAVAVDSSGNIWAAGAGPGDQPIQEFNGSGALLNQFGMGKVGTGTGVAFDPSGNVWVSDLGGSLVEFSNSGTLRQTFANRPPSSMNLPGYLSRLQAWQWTHRARSTSVIRREVPPAALRSSIAAVRISGVSAVRAVAPASSRILVESWLTRRATSGRVTRATIASSSSTAMGIF